MDYGCLIVSLLCLQAEEEPGGGHRGGSVSGAPRWMEHTIGE